MAERLVLVLEGAPSAPDARLLSPNGRGHWAARRLARRRLTLHVLAALLARLGPAPQFQRARITLRFTMPARRRRDPDNHLALMKPAIDALVAAHVLPDDDSVHVEYAPVEWRVAPGQRRTEIVVEAL